MIPLESHAPKIVYIHIGMSKAGSSAIQKVLMDNSDNLHSDGFVYPQSGLYEGAHFEINEQLTSGAFPGKLEKALQEAEGLSPIFSCEGFWLLGAPELKTLSEVLSGRLTKIILYLRNPCGYMPSSYRQSIKTLDSIRTQSDYLEFASERMNYPEVLRRWGDIFQLEVNVYDQYRTSLVNNFLHILGLEPEKYTIPSTPVNQTLPDSTMEAMRLVNFVCSGKPARRARAWIQAHSHLFSRLGLNDALIRDHARRVPLQWDMSIMRRYLSPINLEFLLKGTLLDKGISQSISSSSITL